MLLDIDDELRKILENGYNDIKTQDNAFYRYTRSLNNMSEEFIHKINKSNYAEETTLEEKEIIGDLIFTGKLLTKKQRLALGLYIFCGYKQKQIADILGITQANVSYLIYRAKIKIKKEITK